MALRRAFFLWQFIAAAVLPIWLLIGYAVWGSSVAGLLGVVLVIPLVMIAEIALALLFSARHRIRASRALDGPAIGFLGAFQLGVVGFGFFGPGSAWFGVLAAAAAIGGIWAGSRLLVRDLRAKVRATFPGTRPQPADRTPIDAGEYVVLKPHTR